jgi:hypothetical protein
VGPEDLLRIRSSQKTHSRREGMTSETDLREGFWFEEATHPRWGGASSSSHEFWWNYPFTMLVLIVACEVWSGGEPTYSMPHPNKKSEDWEDDGPQKFIISHNLSLSVLHGVDFAVSFARRKFLCAWNYSKLNQFMLLRLFQPGLAACL